MKTSSLLKGLAVVGAVAAIVWGVQAGIKKHYNFAYDAGKAACEGKQAVATSGVLVVQKQVTAKQLQRQAATGAQREAARSAIDDYFNTLEGQANEPQTSPSSSVDSHACILPPERLRQWAAANAGRSGIAADSGAAASQPNPSPSQAASAQERGDARSGGQSAPISAPVSPAGQPALSAAGLPASSP
jgi:hypothetical protein